MWIEVGTTRVAAIQGDITQQAVDAIVNAANASLAGGGGVDGAIHRAGGPAIMDACRAIRQEQGGCPTGQAVATTAGNLNARVVIHTVGPVWNPSDADACDQLLASAYRCSLEICKSQDLRTVAFPSISTGAYGFPIERAAPIAIATVRQFVSNQPLEEVRFVLFSKGDLDVYRRHLDIPVATS